MTERFPTRPPSPHSGSDQQPEGDTVIHAEEGTVLHANLGAAAQEIPKALASPDQPHLVCLSGPLAGESFALALGEGDLFVLGRGADCSLVLDDGSVSRRHAQLRRAGKFHYLSDLGSANGTLVNDQLISTDHLLKHESTLKVGIYEFTFLDTALTEEEYPSQLPVLASAFDEQIHQGAPPPFPLEAPPKGRSPAALWLLVFVAAAGILFFGIRKIQRDEPLHIGQVWEGLFGPAKGPTLAYPLLEIRTSPMAGDIFFQGEFIGAAPVEKKLLDGVQADTDFELRAEFNLPILEEKAVVTKMIRFARDQEIASHLLEAPIGQIHVKHLPPDTQVLLEYKVTGVEGEPHIRQPTIDYKEPLLVPFGEYKFEIRKNEQFKYRRKFPVNETEPSHVFDLTEDDLAYAPLTITSEPPEADVFLDNEPLNLKTPLRDFRLPMGSHTIVLRKENYQDYLLEALPNPVQVNELLVFDVKLPISAVSEMIVRAKTEFNKGLYKQMETTLYQALRASPAPTPAEQAEIQYWLGQGYLLRKDFKQAFIYFRKAKGFVDAKGEFPFFDQAKLGEARVYQEQGKKQEALRYSVEVFFGAKDIVARSAAEEIFHKVSPVRAVIYVDTVPTEATIYLNQKKIQSQNSKGTKSDAKTPMILPELSVGTYSLLLTKPGYEDHKETVRIGISDLKAVRVRLRPR